jgi:hypothetical protein
MKLTDFLKNNLNTVPSASVWPSKLYLPSERGGLFGLGSSSKIWQHVKDLREFTDIGSKSFSESHTGSTGWEYGAGLVLFWDNLHFSETFTSRNYTEVNSSISVKVTTTSTNSSVTDRLIINDKESDTRTFLGDEINKRAELINSKQYPLQIAGIVHTHPKVKVGSDKIAYTFFSTTDIHSWIASKMPLTVLVTDRIWVLGMTKEFQTHHHHNLQMLSRELNAVSRAELESLDKLYESASAWASSLELALYVAEFGGSLYKI